MKSTTPWKRKMRIWKTEISNIGNLCFVFLLLSQLFSWVGLRCFWHKPTLFRFPNSLRTTSKHRMREYQDPSFMKIENYISADIDIWSISSVLELCCRLVCLPRSFLGCCSRSEACRNWTWTKMENHRLLFSKTKLPKLCIVCFDRKWVSDVGGARASWSKVWCSCCLQSMEFRSSFTQ